MTGDAEDAMRESPEETRLMPTAKRRSHRLMMWIRRGHLYLGLFLFPWVLIYGVSAFLFNHPEIANKQPMQRFSESAFEGTPFQNPKSPELIAESVIMELNRRNQEAIYRFDGTIPARYELGATQGSELIFGSMTYPDKKVHLLFHVLATGGIARAEDLTTPKPEFTAAPFTVSAAEGKPSTPPEPAALPLLVEDSIDKQALASIPGVIKNIGYSPEGGLPRITQVPELVFGVHDGKQLWQARYNSLKGTLSAKLNSEVRRSEVTWRNLVTRLHTIHGYPLAYGPRWIWTVFVDIAAALMVYWALSGILMWWQIKSTRRAGMVIFAISGIVSLFLVSSLYYWMAVPL